MIRYGAPDNPVQEWQDTLDVILTGAFNTIQASIDRLVEGGNGGSIVLVSSSAGLKGTGTDLPAAQAYTAAKRGLVGSMQALAQEYAEHSIRVNTISPTGVVSGMTHNEAMRKMADDTKTKLPALTTKPP